MDNEFKTLFHYTSIESFLKILVSKKIKFNSLKNVNDTFEYERLENKNYAKKFYIACFTTEEESLPLWSIYTNRGYGIQLKFDREPFNNENRKIYLFKNDAYKLLTDHELFKGLIKKCIIKYEKSLPDRVNFVEDFKIQKVTAKLVKTLLVARTKTTTWKFEEETRYIIDLSIKDIKPYGAVYVDIEEEAFNNIEVTLGPSCNDSDLYMVKSIVNTCLNSNIKVSKSKLKVTF